MYNQIQQRSAISKSKPVTAPPNSSGRYILGEYKIPDLLSMRSRIRSTSRYILKTDISKFYPSIYTHSIPWAIHGKVFAKANRGNQHLGNLLDTWIRQGQDGQTIGIPIGPDTSLVIAETILCALDEDITNRMQFINGLRYVDDFEFGVKSYSEAEAILALLQELLKDYQLELNFAKTAIIDLPIPLESNWVPILRNFDFDSPTNYKRQKAALVDYFDKVYEFSRRWPNDSVLKYAIERLKDVGIKSENTAVVQDFFLQCIMVDTSTFRSAVRGLILHNNKGLKLDLNLLSDVFNHQIRKQCPAGRGSEAAWAIWALIYWNISIDSESATALSKMNDPFVALLALDARQRGLMPNNLNTSLWESYMNTSDLYGKHWLLSYEANVKGWLPSSGSSPVR
jgi:hypothetical protein